MIKSSTGSARSRNPGHVESPSDRPVHRLAQQCRSGLAGYGQQLAEAKAAPAAGQLFGSRRDDAPEKGIAATASALITTSNAALHQPASRVRGNQTCDHADGCVPSALRTGEHAIAPLNPVNHAKALALICPLHDGIVAGQRQVARRGELVVSAELAATVREDTWNGVRIRIVSPSVGEVAVNWFGFAEHGVFNERHLPPSPSEGTLNSYNASSLLIAGRIDADHLRAAVAAYTDVFAPTPRATPKRPPSDAPLLPDPSTAERRSRPPSRLDAVAELGHQPRHPTLRQGFRGRTTSDPRPVRRAKPVCPQPRDTLPKDPCH